LAFLVALLLIVVMCLPIKIWVKFLVFCLFSLVQGYTLASMFTNDTIVQFAFYGALSIFVSMIGISAVITMLGVKLGPRVGLGLFSALLLLLMFLLFNIIAGEIANKLLAMVGILLFSMYIVYDTNKILQRDYKGDFISASLDYYLDFLNLFVDISWLNK
jgi:FtsH-binding integral membrane protein